MSKWAVFIKTILYTEGKTELLLNVNFNPAGHKRAAYYQKLKKFKLTGMIVLLNSVLYVVPHKVQVNCTSVSIEVHIPSVWIPKPFCSVNAKQSNWAMMGPILSYWNHAIRACLNFSESDPETVSLVFNGQDECVLVGIVLDDVVVHVHQNTNKKRNRESIIK